MKSIWKAGDSRSIRLTDRISYRAYELLNTNEHLIKWNRNRFLTRAINNQAILEEGTKSEKIALIIKYDLMDLLLANTNSNASDKEYEVADVIEESYKEDNETHELRSSVKNAVDVTSLLSGIPKLK